MSLRAAIYCRVSTEEQADEGYSIEAQKEKLTSFCSFSVNDRGEDAFTVSGYYVDDGYSGRSTARPGYQKMMSEIDQWDAIVVFKMDRIHRNSRNFMNMMDTLGRKGKQFVSATEDLDTSNAIGRFVMAMIQNIAQLESEQIGERTYMGMRQKAETMDNGIDLSRTMGLSPPFGYGFDDGNLVGIPSELDEVSGMFVDCLNGESMESIADGLNRSGVRTHRGNRWSKVSVSNILHNPVYAGYLRWEELLYHHNADTAVDVSSFDEVQRRIASRIRDPTKRRVELLSERIATS